MVLSQFISKKIEQIVFGEFQIIINIEDNLKVIIENDIELNSKMYTQANILDTAGVLVKWIGLTISELSISSDDVLVLRCNNEGLAKVYKDGMYESYQVLTDTEQMVCTPNGLEVL